MHSFFAETAACCTLCLKQQSYVKELFATLQSADIRLMFLIIFTELTHFSADNCFNKFTHSAAIFSLTSIWTLCQIIFILDWFCCVCHMTASSFKDIFLTILCSSSCSLVLFQYFDSVSTHQFSQFCKRSTVTGSETALY